MTEHHSGGESRERGSGLAFLDESKEGERDRGLRNRGKGGPRVSEVADEHNGGDDAAQW